MCTQSETDLLFHDPLIWHVCYLLQVLAFFTGILWIVALVIALLKRRDVVHDPVLYSHATWQIRTVFYALLWIILSSLLGLLGALTLVIGIGVVFIAIAVGLGIWVFVWVIYRVIYGWIKLYERQPVPVRLHTHASFF